MHAYHQPESEPLIFMFQKDKINCPNKQSLDTPTDH